ncbi:MAG: hypothetical protein HC842_02730 [Cytophagales bacterium]|nr:hypothetical protein [Cytophagales bacterium]
MKFWVLAFLVFLVPQLLCAQYREVGGSLGTFSYTGDLVRAIQVADMRPGLHVFYRHSRNHILSLRHSLGLGWVSSGDYNPTTAAPSPQTHSFDAYMATLTTSFEYHFSILKKKAPPYAGLPIFMQAWVCLELWAKAVPGTTLTLLRSFPLALASNTNWTQNTP